MATAKTFTVEAPNKKFTGRRLGVGFKDGKAKDVPLAQALQLVAQGYECPAAEKEAEKAREAASADAEDSTPKRSSTRKRSSKSKSKTSTDDDKSGDDSNGGGDGDGDASK